MQMCSRLSVVMDLLGPSDASMSTLLGYTNATTLSQVRRGATFPDVERLVNLGLITVGGNATPNLHWVLTGIGKAFLPTDPNSSAARSASSALSQVAMMKRGEVSAVAKKSSSASGHATPK